MLYERLAWQAAFDISREIHADFPAEDRIRSNKMEKNGYTRILADIKSGLDHSVEWSQGGCPMSPIVLIVEGKNDRSRLRRLLRDEVRIHCTFGTPGTGRIEQLKKAVGGADPVYIFTDNDPSGRKIRALLRDAFPDAEQIYTRKGYAGVEGTPDDYLVQQLEKAGLGEYIVYPASGLAGFHE